MKNIFQTPSTRAIICVVLLTGNGRAENPAEKETQSAHTWRERQAWAARFLDWYIGTVGAGVFTGPPEARLTTAYGQLVENEQAARKELTGCLQVPTASTRLEIARALMVTAGRPVGAKCAFEKIEDLAYAWAESIQQKIRHLLDASKDPKERSLFPIPGGMIAFRRRLPKSIDPRSRLGELLQVEQWQDNTLTRCGPNVAGADQVGLYEVLSLSQNLVEEQLEECALAVTQHRDTLLAIEPLLSTDVAGPK